ncbi:MAG: short-chain dehydrogenase/reductase [Myxococcales bacterium]|nr:short-chain dehydrogenase/reductase [Myxococcales bacterium]
MSSLTGKRALVTGASSGIGAAIARELAARGASLVLTARRKAELDTIATSCGGAQVIPADLGTRDGAAIVWNAAIAGGPIDILVNNAGFGAFRPFDDTDWSRDAEMIQLNMTALVELCKRFVMSHKGKPERRYLVNIASIGAYQSVPNMALYSASKAFVRNFTEGLHDELAGSALSATCICPGGTKTAFHDAAGAGNYGWVANVSMMTAEQVAQISVRAMVGGRRTVIPGFINKIACWSVRLVPRWFASLMSRRVLGKPRAGALPPRTGAAA